MGRAASIGKSLVQLRSYMHFRNRGFKLEEDRIERRLQECPWCHMSRLINFWLNVWRESISEVRNISGKEWVYSACPFFRVLRVPRSCSRSHGAIKRSSLYFTKRKDCLSEEPLSSMRSLNDNRSGLSIGFRTADSLRNDVVNIWSY